MSDIKKKNKKKKNDFVISLSHSYFVISLNPSYFVKSQNLFTLWPHQKTLSVLKYETHTDNFCTAGIPSFELSIDYSLYLQTSDCA